MKTKLTILLIVLISSSLSTLYAQKLRVNFNSAELNPANNTIQIVYDLKGFKKRYYNTHLYYSNNNGNSFKGPLRAVIGEIGDSLKAGEFKKVQWEFMKDNPYFDGKNITFRVEAIEVPKVATGGPKNALYSLMVPGWGDYKVRNGYNYKWITIGTYTLLGAGIFFQTKSLLAYQEYLDRKPNSIDDHNRLFNTANTDTKIAAAFFITAGACWLADIIGVYWKGKQNQKKYNPKEEEEEETSSIWKPTISPYTVGIHSGITLRWKLNP
ncbi:MAG: hypothetical protein EAZ55_13495 [Cytophagales bacterium]|nr:MAG: hypothetical protein EAZ55_13495 [Cytophagales bacterium]